MQEIQQKTYKPRSFQEALKKNPKHGKNTFYEVPPNPPKRALCPFFLYRMDIYDQIKLENPNLKITQITRIIGEMWKYLDPKLKDRYEQQYQLNHKEAAEAKEQYERIYGKQARSRSSKKVKRALGQLKKFFDR